MGRTKKIFFERTRRGFPSLWEAGGGYTNTGEATIIVGRDGQPKKAVYIKKRGHLANGKHALIPIEVGDYIIFANHHRRDFEIEIYKIEDFEGETAGETVVVEQVNHFSMGEWNAELPAFLKAAVEAAVEKATCYHCREPHFAKEPAPVFPHPHNNH